MSLSNFLRINQFKIVKVGAAPGQESLYYSRIELDGESAQLPEPERHRLIADKARFLIRELHEHGIEGHLGSYPPTSDQAAVIITAGFAKLHELGALLEIQPWTQRLGPDGKPSATAWGLGPGH